MVNRHSDPSDDAAPDAVGRGPAAADDSHLRQSLADLSTLATSHGPQGFEEMLTHVAQFAVQAIPGADGAGLTLFQNDRPDTVVATDVFVREVDDIQYALNEGPCITAAAEGRTVSSGSLGVDRAWPRFGPRASQLGVHSVLSLPLLLDGAGSLGSMNVYAREKDAFDFRAAQLGELFAVPAAISVQNAQALFQARRLATQLQAALTSRTIIDQSLGILMSRSGCTADEAFDKLRTMSQAENRKSAVVARSIVEQAVRRARARHAQ